MAKTSKKKHAADDDSAAVKPAGKKKKATAAGIAATAEGADAQIKVFTDDLKKLIDSHKPLQYLKPGIEKLGEIKDYKTITRFFRIAAISLRDEINKIKPDGAYEDMAHELERKINNLELNLKEKNEKIDDLSEKLNGLREEYVNMRNKLTSVNEELINNNIRKILLLFLPVLDNFTMAAMSKEKQHDHKTILDGLMMVYEQFKKVLAQAGIEETAYLGQKFDPKFHEAIEEIVDDTKEEGAIVEEVRKAYFFKGKPLRPAMVKIAKHS